MLYLFPTPPPSLDWVTGSGDRPGPAGSPGGVTRGAGRTAGAEACGYYGVYRRGCGQGGSDGRYDTEPPSHPWRGGDPRVAFSRSAHEGLSVRFSDVICNLGKKFGELQMER